MTLIQVLHVVVLTAGSACLCIVSVRTIHRCTISSRPPAGATIWGALVIALIVSVAPTAVAMGGAVATIAAPMVLAAGLLALAISDSVYNAVQTLADWAVVGEASINRLQDNDNDENPAADFSVEEIDLLDKADRSLSDSMRSLDDTPLRQEPL